LSRRDRPLTARCAICTSVDGAKASVSRDSDTTLMAPSLVGRVHARQPPRAGIPCLRRNLEPTVTETSVDETIYGERVRASSAGRRRRSRCGALRITAAAACRTRPIQALGSHRTGSGSIWYNKPHPQPPLLSLLGVPMKHARRLWRLGEEIQSRWWVQQSCSMIITRACPSLCTPACQPAMPSHNRHYGRTSCRHLSSVASAGLGLGA
jgi:hypothetical protein